MRLFVKMLLVQYQVVVAIDNASKGSLRPVGFVLLLHAEATAVLFSASSLGFFTHLNA